MKTVLIVTPSFPPQAYVGGLRPAMFSKYLPKFRWDPIILTGIFPEVDLVSKPMMKIEGVPPQEKIFKVEMVNSTPNGKCSLMNNVIFKKIKSFFMPDFFQPPGFVEAMIIEGEKILKNNKIDVIYTTTPFFGSLTVANHLSRKFSIPWVADFRDIFEQDSASHFREKLLYLRLRYRRKVITKTASAIITVSNHHANVLEYSLGKKVHVIPNGYDPTLFQAKEQHQSKKFTIVYMGRLLDEWQRNPRPLFEALDILLSNNEIDADRFEVSFYGAEFDLITRIVDNYKCKVLVNILPRVNYEDVPKLLQNACVNLILTNSGRLGVLTTKAFEYLAVKRPVLSIPDDQGELSELIKKTNAGAVCNDADAIVAVLKRWYLEWKETGTVACKSDDNEVLKYSREQQAGELSGILSQCLEKKD